MGGSRQPRENELVIECTQGRRVAGIARRLKRRTKLSHGGARVVPLGVNV